MHRTPRPHTAALFALLACLVAAPALQAAPNERDAAPNTSKPKPQRASAPKIIPSGSEEKPRDRERRLLRECKGRPNAGACSGYAS